MDFLCGFCVKLCIFCGKNTPQMAEKKKWRAAEKGLINLSFPFLTEEALHDVQCFPPARLLLC